MLNKMEWRVEDHFISNNGVVNSEQNIVQLYNSLTLDFYNINAINKSAYKFIIQMGLLKCVPSR